VKAAPDQPFITLAVEPPEGAGAGFTAEVDDEAGALVVAPWPAAGPPPGEPLQLLIPTRDLVPGRYRLVVKDAAAGAASGNNRELGSYSFVFERTRS
jgi:hypothetical protein